LRFRIEIAVRMLCIAWASARNSDSSLNGLLTFLVRCHLSKNARSCFAYLRSDGNPLAAEV
jgi:hypothetical protein